MILLLPFQYSHDLPAKRRAFTQRSQLVPGQAGTQALVPACSPRKERHYSIAAAAGKTTSSAVGSSQNLMLLITSRRQN